MDYTPTFEPPPKGSKEWREIALSVYEAARESAQASDVLMWQIASIVWGANVLLLSAASEAIRDHAPILVVALTIALGVCLSIFVPRFFWLSKIGQRVAYEKCREIEAYFPKELRLHMDLHETYEAGNKWKKFRIFDQKVGRAQIWVYSISLLLIVGWAIVIGWVLLYWCYTAHGSLDSVPIGSVL